MTQIVRICKLSVILVQGRFLYLNRLFISLVKVKDVQIVVELAVKTTKHDEAAAHKDR
jgi:hypothetical protein